MLAEIVDFIQKEEKRFEKVICSRARTNVCLQSVYLLIVVLVMIFRWFRYKPQNEQKNNRRDQLKFDLIDETEIVPEAIWN